MNGLSFVTTDFTGVTTALSTSYNTAEIVAIIALVIGSTIGVSLVWWGSRKLVRAVIGAFKTGKIKF